MGGGAVDGMGSVVGEAAPPFVGGSDGDGEVEVRELAAIMVVACRFAGLLVARKTFKRRDLNFVRFSSRAALASS